MTPTSFERNGWRACFAIGGLAIVIGGPMHPDGTMAQVLADPKWFLSHVLVLIGFVGLSAGLALWRPNDRLVPRTAMWRRLALWVSVAQTIDMAFHTAAMVDAGPLAAGAPTPVLTTHLWMTQFVYPVFAVVLIGFLIAAANDGLLGSWRIAWLGIIGAIGHGLAGLLVPVLEIEWARWGFPLIVLVAVWMIAAAAWPARASSAAA